MGTTNSLEKELRAEIESLRIRLKKAEDTLRAIGNGEVDAFAVSGPEEEQVFTLKGAEQPYRSRVGTMNEGAAIPADDISERKRADEALRQSEERLAMALEGGRMGLWEWDTHSNRSVCNATGYQLLGLPVGGGIEETHLFFDRIHPEDAVLFKKILADVVKKGSDFYHEIRIIRADNGQVRWMAAAGRLIRDNAGQPMKMLGVNFDITERKQAEDALKKLNDELETRVEERTAELHEKDQILLQQSRQAAMGEMIGNIAHQWRQPLNSLGLTIQSLLMFYDLGELDRELLEKNVHSSMKLIRHMSKTIDDFRNYFNPEKVKSEFKVREAVARTLSLLDGSMQNPRISVEVTAMDDPVIYGYVNEFAQVLFNILINARDAFIERAIDDPRITITICCKERCACVTVADNAGGIREEIIDKIFDPYFTTKGPQQGSGVGLFMSKSIIEKNMGGRLVVANIENGAEFRIEVNNENRF